MPAKTYISRIARHRIVMKPTTTRIDGSIEPGRVIQFDNHRYTTDDEEEQKAIEGCLDFGRLIFVEGQGPKPPQQDAEIERLRRENANLTAQINQLAQRLAQLESASKSHGAVVGDVGRPYDETTVPPDLPDDNGETAQVVMCEALTRSGTRCKNDAAVEKDGMYLCHIHARE